MTQTFWVARVIATASVAGMVLSASAALADDGTTATQTPTNVSSSDKAAASKANAVPGSDQVDDLITNNNLRAYSGSTSRWSVASQYNYNGGTISSPMSQDRPNISAMSGNTVKADLDGSISAKFNINPTNSVLAGFGIRWIAPFAGSGLTNYDGTRFDAMNPYLTYQYIYKWLGVQSILQVSGMQWTQSDQTALGYARQLNVDQENMFEIGKTGVSIGASMWGQYQWFNKSGSVGDPNSANYIPDLAPLQSVWEFGVSPELEWQFSEKFNFRTLLSLWTYEHYQSFPGMALTHDTVYQSVGIGCSITRDIFLYPNVQYLPKKPEAALTNVALAATINLF